MSEYVENPTTDRHRDYNRKVAIVNKIQLMLMSSSNDDLKRIAWNVEQELEAVINRWYGPYQEAKR